MTDKELLTLAARAAGIMGTYREPVGAHPYGIEVCDSQGVCYDWNPLHSPGDALRLAVQLSLIVESGGNRAIVFRPGADESVLKPIEWYAENGNDHLAATMRAIVRAAAEIGRRMPE